MKTGTKIVAGFAVAVLIAIAIGGIAWSSTSRIGAELRDVSNAKFPSVVALAEMDEALTAVARGLNALMLPRADLAQRERALKDVERAYGRIESGRKEYEELPHGVEALALWRELQQPWTEWERSTRALLQLVAERESLLQQGKTQDSPELAALDERTWTAYLGARKAFEPATTAITRAKDQTRKDVDAAAQRGERAIGAAVTAIAVAIALGAAVLFGLGLVIARGIARTLRELVAEAAKLSAAVQKGTLAVRGEAAAIHPEFRPIVEGMNRTMDAFAKPIEVTASYLSRIAKGDIPPKIIDHYEGDFDLIKRSLNSCIDAVQGLVADARGLAGAAVEGKLTTRADAARHQGDFRKIVQGVNDTLDAVLAPIQEAAGVLEQLAQRDLTARVKGSYQGDHAKIKDALNATAEALHDSMAQVAQAVDQISSASAQIASSSQSVADGASEQASSLEESSSQLESMAAMTKQSTDHAVQANGLAQRAKSTATEGAAAMEQMAGAMGKIKTSAEGTSQIIKDINEIAFQTNLLALNAAVEAARAGEAGRGFAVVAEEVRSLALRSKEAANKTEELIRQSVKEAAEGEVTSKHVNDKLAEIVGGIGKVSDIVSELTASAREQTQGIDQVNKAVGQMDKVTQQNAANSEESSSAASELSGQAQELAAMVGSFRLERQHSARAAAPKAEARQRAATPVVKSAPARKRGAIPLRPEQVIPLDDDAAFRDF